ncbi:hypothetical protein BD410DRAFT_760578 [Rickenella mellea]|uniref:Protein kinase domain-containing protein n=1 Tax=Rickenella mellea TaxID=50990 RepID=A0A4Y7QMK0_9AGAM|nr:hypothetical protein BD410DRAFT_760578 [Rickenella mellea]
MLASVLDGDVLKSEKSRIQFALESSSDEANNRHVDVWIGIRAKLRRRKEDEERKRLDERRRRMVDPVIHEIMTFHVVNGPGSPSALQQVNAVLGRLDSVRSLYPNLKAFALDKPAISSTEFQARRDTLNSWSTVLSTLRQQINTLRKWTGSEALDPGRHGLHEHLDGSTFVERVLKEDSLQRTFEKGFLTTVHALIASARDTQVNLAALFKELNLPTFEEELVQLISFPTRLVQACLRVRLEYANKVRDPDILIIDQMLEDFRLTIGLACTLKRQYEAFRFPDPGGNWNPPSCISDDYDATLLEALNFFFKLIHWKLKSASKDIYFKETDVLEAQWATFNDVSLTVPGGAPLVAEQLCALTNKLLARVTTNFERQIRVPITSKDRAALIVTPTRRPHSPAYVNGLGFDFHNLLTEGSNKGRIMSDEQVVNWYAKVLESVRIRYRKLQRFARALSQRFSNAAEYTLENVNLDLFIAGLIETDHVLVYTQSFEEEGTYIVASRALRDRPETIRRILRDAYHVNELWGDGYRIARPDGTSDQDDDEYEDSGYLLILSPRSRFLWNGLVLVLPLSRIDFELKDNRVRIVADGPHLRLGLAKQLFTEVFLSVDEDGEPVAPFIPPLQCIFEQMAHLPPVNRELRKINSVTTRLAEDIVKSVHHVRRTLSGVPNCSELLESWYLFSSEHGQHAQKYMERPSWMKYNRLLIRLAISWVSFICDDCNPSDRKTFRWAVSALEFTLLRTKRNNILHLPDDQFELLRSKVASCMTLLISHFDILGARSTLEAKREREQQEEALRHMLTDENCADADEDFLRSYTPDHEEGSAMTSAWDRSIRRLREDVLRTLGHLDERRAGVGSDQRMIGRVLDNEKPEDRSLMFLASSSSNISIRWQQGRFIGAGAFGSVYMAVNLDSGSVMAVKEVRYQEVPGMPNLYKQIQDELRVMEMLHHPNVVEYYGIEVHRDKIYIFEEFCEGGSLAANLEVGRIADEHIVQVYTMQMLEGLSYLHSQGIVHRDIKPDNILLDHMGVLKFVDFGAAKVIAKNSRTIQRTRIAPGNPLPGAIGMNNSLTGTPMYMSPEVIKNDKRGRHGAMDIWSMGCVVLECATGRKPWSNLDNEWAIMFHIGVATQHPPLPEKGELSDMGINFIKQCLTIDPMKRPTAQELMDHPWMVQFMETLRSYEEEEMASGPHGDMPSEQDFQGATVARQAAIIEQKEVEAINCSSPEFATPPSDTPGTPGFDLTS